VLEYACAGDLAIFLRSHDAPAVAMVPAAAAAGDDCSAANNRLRYTSSDAYRMSEVYKYKSTLNNFC